MHTMPRTFFRIAPALACAALVLAQGPEADPAPSTPIATLPMTTPLGLPFVWATVGGGEPRWLCFDTGATQTFLDRTFVEGLGFAVQDLGTSTQPGGTVRFGKTSGVTLQLGAFTWPNRTVGAVPMGQLTGAVGRPLWGIMGYDLPQAKVVELDYGAGRMRLYEPEGFRYSGRGEALDLEIRRTKPLVKLRLTRRDGEEVTGKFLVDAGSAQTISLSPHFYDEVIAADQPSVAARGWGFGGTQATGKLVRIDKVVLGRHTFTDVVAHAVVSDGTSGRRFYAGIIGGELLRRFTVTFDYRRTRMFLEPNAAITAPLRESLTGLEFAADGAVPTEIRVFHVYEGSPADRAGIRRDDVLLEVDGRSALQIGIEGLWNGLREGVTAKHTLLLRRGENQRTVTLELERLPI